MDIIQQPYSTRLVYSSTIPALEGGVEFPHPLIFVDRDPQGRVIAITAAGTQAQILKELGPQYGEHAEDLVLALYDRFPAREWREGVARPERLAQAEVIVARALQDWTASGATQMSAIGEHVHRHMVRAHRQGLV